MLTIIIIVFLFSLLIILHEAGHFWAARRGGVEVDEFGVGFPPKAWGKKFGKTLYTINWLPLGGFVRLKGEDESDDEPGSFNAARLSTKTKILLAGVGMNLLTAFVLFYVLAVSGMPGLGGVFEPSFLKSTYAQPKQLLLANVVADSPAAQAGLIRGDYILSINGQPTTSDTELRDLTKKYAGQTVTVVAKKSGDETTLQIKLRDPGSTEGYLGVVSQQVYKLKYDPLSAVVAALYVTGALFVATIVGIVQLFLNLPALLLGLFTNGVPSSAEAASGPIGIIFILKSLTSLGWSYVILFMANISVALAAFNVLPLPALDGGRLAVILFSRITHRKISAEAEARYHTIGFIALIAFMVLISVYDFRKYF